MLFEWLSKTQLRLKALFHRSRLDRELEEELTFHLEKSAEKNRVWGIDADEAGYAARRQFGNLSSMKERNREMWMFLSIESSWRDIRYGARALRKSPGFTVVAVLTLALGIGANTAIFGVINNVLLSPLPYKDPQQLVARKQNDSLLNTIDIQRQASAFSSGGGVNIEDMDYTGGTEPIQIRAAYIDAGFFETLGVAPLLGRTISPEEDVKGGPRLMVVNHAFWENFLSSDPHALGRTLTLSGNAYTVIGVMPAAFALPRERADIFVSLWVAYPEAAAFRGVHFMHTYWRLKPGVTLAQAQAEMRGIDRQLAEQYPDSERDRQTILVSMREQLVGDIRPALFVLFGAVGLVLLISCANFAGLLMARCATQRQELLIRSALGAGKARLARQALTESLLLSIAGGTVGLLFARWGTSFLLLLKPAALERFNRIHIDVRMLSFALSVSILTGIIFGLAPAWSAARSDLAQSLKERGRGLAAGPSGHLLRRLLVMAEFALALVLLMGAGLFIKGFWRLRSVDPGFNAANVLTMHLQLPASRYAEIPPQTQFRREVLARLNSLPAIEAAMVTDIPLGGNYLSHSFMIDGRPPVPVGAEPEVQTLSVMGDYFRAMQIPLRAGRDFTPMDREGQPLVAIVNEEFVKEFFPHQDPLAARIDWSRREGPHQWMTIVGVVADVKHSALSLPPDPAIYAPYAQSDEAWRRWATLVIRSPEASVGLVEAVKKQVWSVDGQVPVSDIHSMDELLAESVAQQRFNMIVLTIFAALALLLAAVGIYGLMAYTVNQRTHEIGVRIAVGARQRDVLTLVLGEGAKLTLLGIVIGTAAAFALTRLMTSLLFDVKPTDPATFAGVAVILAAVALAACYIPARRATRVDPIVALRYE